MSQNKAVDDGMVSCNSSYLRYELIIRCGWDENGMLSSYHVFLLFQGYFRKGEAEFKAEHYKEALQSFKVSHLCDLLV